MYYVYMLRCSDGSIYTGSAADLEKRFEKHKNGLGAKYTKSHPPVRIETAFSCETYGDALKLEYYIKRLSRLKKEAIIGGTAPESLIGDKIDGNLYERIKKTE